MGCARRVGVILGLEFAGGGSGCGAARTCGAGVTRNGADFPRCRAMHVGAWTARGGLANLVRLEELCISPSAEAAVSTGSGDAGGMQNRSFRRGLQSRVTPGTPDVPNRYTAPGLATDRAVLHVGGRRRAGRSGPAAHRSRTLPCATMSARSHPRSPSPAKTTQAMRPSRRRSASVPPTTIVRADEPEDSAART